MVSLGEIFVLTIFAEDANRNLKNAIYSYNRNPTSNPSSIIDVDLEPQHTVLSFAFVTETTMQNASLVMYNTDQLQRCIFNYDNSYYFTSQFNLNLIDSFKGQVVCNFSIEMLFVIISVMYTCRMVYLQ